AASSSRGSSAPPAPTRSTSSRSRSGASRRPRPTRITGAERADGPSANAHVAAGVSLLGIDDLPQVDVAGAEDCSAAQQVIAPHAVEAVAVFLPKLRPCLFEIGMPGHQGPVVIG